MQLCPAVNHKKTDGREDCAMDVGATVELNRARGDSELEPFGMRGRTDDAICIQAAANRDDYRSNYLQCRLTIQSQVAEIVRCRRS